MTGIAIFTHGDVGNSMIQAVELIIGQQEQVRTVSLHHGDGIEDFKKRCIDSIREIETGDGVLIFVDFLGGTPANTVLQSFEQSNVPCITGVNMPMLLDVFTSRDTHNIKQLTEQALKYGIQGICRLDLLVTDNGDSTAEAF